MATEEEEDQARRNAAKEEAELKAARAILDLKKKSNLASERELELEENILKRKELRKELDAASLQQDDQRIENLLKEIDELEKRHDRLKDINTALEAATTHGQNFADTIIGLRNPLIRAADSAGSFSAAISKSAQGVAERVKQTGILAFGIDRLFTNTKKLVTALDAQAASFVQNTGASRDFAYEAFQLRGSLATVGVSGNDAVKSMGTLFSQFKDFTQLTPGLRGEFTKLASQLDKLGFDTGGVAEALTNVAGMSASEALPAIRNLAGAAEASGLTFQEFSSQLASSGALFAKFGEQGIEVFKGLAAAAKETGMQVSELYNIASQYDTFEGAAEAAGRLNMVLGGNLIDTYTLLSASEEERIQLLQQSLEASGQTWESMDRFQHIELSRALGIGLEEAARLFSSTSQEVRKTAAEIMHADMTTEELAQRTRDAATAIDMLKTFFENAAIAVAPFVETMNKVVGGFMRFSESVFGGNGVAAAITTLIGSFTALKVATALVTGPWRLLSSGATALATRVLPSLGASAAASGTAAGFGAPGMLAFGGAVALIGAGAAAAAWGIAQIVRSIGEVAVIEGAGQAFKDIGAGMLSIGAASVAAMFGLGGLGALVFSVGSIVRKINKLDPDKASSFETIMSSLGDFGSSENLSANLTAVEGFVGNMSALLDDLPESKAIAFEGMTSGLAETLTQINALSPENIKQTIELVRVASETQQEATQTSGIAMIAAMHPMLAAHRQLVEILSDARNTVSETIIELDGTRLGSWLDRRSNQIAARVAEFRGGD